MNTNYKKTAKLLWITFANFIACYLCYAPSSGLGKGWKCTLLQPYWKDKERGTKGIEHIKMRAVTGEIWTQK
jgi:hypothetical protein